MSQSLIGKYESIRQKFDEVSHAIAAPDAVSDMKRYAELNREYRYLEKLINAFVQYDAILKNTTSANELLQIEKDEEMRQLAKEELSELAQQQAAKEEEIKHLLIPEDPEDSKNVVLEIRAGTGGDEASIFAGDLFRMYQKFVDIRGWKMSLDRMTEGTSGGYKEIVATISGENAYGVMKYESGVHRVQRVPQTETQGRVHTSAATVAVLPEAEEFDLEIKDSEIRKDTYMSSGPGGQSVNTTYSAIRLTHIPTGMVVTCQDEKSQLKNLAAAMKELRTRLYTMEMEKRMTEEAQKRKSLVSTGDRSAKIRTYNYPQSRLTEHRINLTLYNLPAVMNGDLDEIIERLKIEENAEKLKSISVE